MDFADVAELQVVVEGVGLPVEKSALVAYAAAQGAKPTQLEILERLPDRKFETIDDVAECLIRVQPEREADVPHAPREESGAPPGGAGYTNAAPVSGFVRE